VSYPENRKEGTQILKVELFDLSGNKVLEKIEEQHSLDVEKLQAGMYLLIIELKNQVVRKKLLIE